MFPYRTEATTTIPSGRCRARLVITQPVRALMKFSAPPIGGPNDLFVEGTHQMVTHSIKKLATSNHLMTAGMRSSARDVKPGMRATLLGCVAMACVAGIAMPPDSAPAQSACQQTPSLTQRPSALPADVCASGAMIDAKDFYALSWQMFKFLIWPAGERGQSHATKSILSMDGPRVFETFKAEWEIFRDQARTPVPWSEYPPTTCGNQPNVAQGALVLASSSKFDSMTAGGRNAHLLVAQNRSYVRYQAGYNEPLFNTIKDPNRRLYDAGILDSLQPAQATQDIDPKASVPVGSMVVKSAWIELPGPAGGLDESRFYIRRDAWVQRPGTDQCYKSDVGLVGLHIVYKTPSLPHWIWATFEHADNVPEPGDPSDKRYVFNNGNGQPIPPSVPETYLVDRPSGVPGPTDPPQPYQVERLQEIDPKVLAINQTWQDELGGIGSVWKNYKLIMSQWQSSPFISHEDVTIHEPVPTCNSDGKAPASANTTMETFQQRCKLKLTCMGCHNEARTTDFIWAISLNKNTRPTFSMPTRREESIKKLKELLLDR
jgi:hypothetical protein